MQKMKGLYVKKKRSKRLLIQNKVIYFSSILNCIGKILKYFYYSKSIKSLTNTTAVVLPKREEKYLKLEFLLGIFSLLSFPFLFFESTK